MFYYNEVIYISNDDDDTRSHVTDSPAICPTRKFHCYRYIVESSIALFLLSLYHKLNINIKMQRQPNENHYLVASLQNAC